MVACCRERVVLRDLEEKAVKLDRAEAALREALDQKIQLSLEMGKLKEALANHSLKSVGLARRK